MSKRRTGSQGGNGVDGMLSAKNVTAPPSTLENPSDLVNSNY